MKIVSAFVLSVSVVSCSSSPAPVATPAPVAAPAVPAGNVYTRVPAQADSFKLTQRSAVTGMPNDSLFRFSDGTRALVSVIIYEPGADVKVDPDSQKWTAREGEKFRQVQQIQKDRGRISDFTVALSDTVRFTAGGRRILEHMIVVPTRFPNGQIVLEMQYLYLIDGKFVKVRGSVPDQTSGGANTGRVPPFARTLALRVAGG
jgi:hypothetical protein